MQNFHILSGGQQKQLALETQTLSHMEPGSYFHRFLEHLIRNNNGGVAVHDKQMRYLFVSEHYLKQYHIKGNIIGKNHYEVFPDLPDKWKAVHRRVLNGESLSGDDDPYM